MPRFINPVPQYIDAPGGSLSFFTSGTNDFITIYSDDSEEIALKNPISLDEVGRVPDFFYSGVARVVLKDVYGVQIWERDPVGSSDALGALAAWSNSVIYDENDFVFTTAGSFYRSLKSGNANNNPDDNPSNSEFWELVDFLSLYNQKVSYSTNEFCFKDGVIYVSQINDNINNDPASDDGTNWLSISDSSLSSYDNSLSIFNSDNVQSTLNEVSSRLDSLPLIRNFVDINEYGNNEAGFANALADLNGTGFILVLDTNVPLDLSGDIAHTVEGMVIMGGGTFQLSNYTNGGVVNILGNSVSPLFIGDGVVIQDCVFYYPNQVTTNPPVTYPATMLFRNQSAAVQSINVDILNNVFVNSFIAINTNGSLANSANPAFVRIERNKGCCLNTFINHPFTLAECNFNSNTITYAWWRESIGQPVREYINDVSRGVVVGDCDGTTCSGNFFFGLGSAFKFESTSAVTTLTGNVTDGCRYCLDISDAEVLGNLSISGGMMLAKNRIDDTDTECVAIRGQIGQTISGQISISGVHFGAANGNHIDIEQLAGNCFLRLNVDADLYNAGRNDPGNPHYSIRFIDTSDSAKVRVRGIIEDSINGIGSGFTGVYVEGCEMVDVDVMMEGFDDGINIVSSNASSRYRVAGMFKDVTNDVVTSGLTSGQLQYGQLYTSDLPSLQNTVASAATLPLPDNTSEFFTVTGNSNITDIDGKREGRVVTLKFNGALTLTDGGNLSLNGDYTTTANDTLQLGCDGATWFEVSRSAN